MRSGLIVEKSNNSIKLKLVFRHWEGRPYYLSTSETGFVKIQHAFTVQYKTNTHTALSKLGLKGNSSHAVLSSCKCLSSYHVHWLLFYCFDKGMAKGNLEKKEFFCTSQFQRHRSPSWREAWWPEQKAESSYLQTRAQNRGNELELMNGYMLLKSTPSGILLPARLHPVNLPKQCQKVKTECPNPWACWGHFSFNPPHHWFMIMHGMLSS